MEDSAGCVLGQRLDFLVQKLVFSSASRLKLLRRVEVFHEVHIHSVVVDVNVSVDAFALKLFDTLSCDSFFSGGEHGPLCRHDSFVHCTIQLLKRSQDSHTTFRNG